MKIIILIAVAALCLWPLISWATYHFSGWQKWEKLFRRDVTNDNDIASSVSLKKFWNYDHAVRVGVEDFGIAFEPTMFLLFHKSFAIPWVQILSFQYTPGRLSNVCTLNTSQGIIHIYGEVAEIVARGCSHHYVAQING